MSKLQHFQRYKIKYEMLFLCCYFLINSTLLATSVVMEAQRRNTELPFELWEPFSWEYASAISMVMLIPAIYIFTRKFVFDWQAIGKTIFIYFLASIVFFPVACWHYGSD